MTRAICSAMTVAVLLAGGEARAQAVHTPQLPTEEVGVTLGIYRLEDGGGFAGLRISHAFNPVVALEVSVDHQGAPSTTTAPDNLLFTTAARFSIPSPSYQPRGYVTLGVARATSFDWNYSPLVGVGIQSPWDSTGHLTFRVEFQRFASGRKRLYDRGRLLLSGVIGFGRE
jgi:hypothetical protein